MARTYRKPAKATEALRSQLVEYRVRCREHRRRNTEMRYELRSVKARLNDLIHIASLAGVSIPDHCRGRASSDNASAS
jgi:hypothetical protein